MDVGHKKKNGVMKNILLIIITVLLFVRCDKQRDLYDVARPLLYIEGDWKPSLNVEDMSQSATVIIYDSYGPLVKEYFLNPKSVTTNITNGVIDILLFNGLMYSPNETHLDNIVFKGTNKPETFEAVAKEAPASRRLTRKEGEYLASNEMEILTSVCKRDTIDSSNGYFIRYKNGKNGFPEVSDYINDSVYMAPWAVSYEAQVTVHLINPSSALIATGALRGFAGSVFMATRMPSHMNVTHQLKLNSLKIATPGIPGDPQHPEKGTIESPVFVTFGPPVDLPERKYEFEISIVLKDGSVVEKTFDVTSQVLPIIEKIKENLMATSPSQFKLTIPLDIFVTLPIVSSETGIGIGVGDWGDDEVIRFPIM